MGKPTFYITTPIYYPNDKLHVGHAYSTTVVDTMARYKRLRGFDVRFLTGTDEHGQKLLRRAEAAGQAPQAFIDGIVAGIKALWQRLDISYDDFLRTTDERHKIRVQRIFSMLLEKGDIYLGEYEGWYCTSCESYWTERQLSEGKCPDCAGPVERFREMSYFFRMNRYADRLIAYYEEHPDFIYPESRKQEMLSNFLLPGLEDLCISRTAMPWGIPVPNDPERVIYVWLDALTNYITALGYPFQDEERDELFSRYWPADAHVMAKEIVRFHAIYWPIMLMALDLPLPKRIVGHGWLLMKDGKMSKSKGNVIDPNTLIDRYGSDALRYFLLREFSFGQDGVFTLEAIVERMNYDLANDFGNLVHRTLSMVERFCEGKIPAPGTLTELELEIGELMKTCKGQAEAALDAFDYSGALSQIWMIIRRGNQYVDETAPWALSKRKETERLSTVMYFACEMIRTVAILVAPFMPKTPAAVFAKLGLPSDSEIVWEDAAVYGVLPSGIAVAKGEPLFPRLDVAEEMEALQAVMGKSTEGGLSVEQTKGVPARSVANKEPVQKEHVHSDAAASGDKLEGIARLIDIDDFAKVELRVAGVVFAERVPKADKLLRLELDLGVEKRQVVSGIAKFYEPSDLIGQKVILVANLKPVKLRGVESHGMILAASHGDQLVLATVAGDIPLGAVVK
ncbi:methionine--tRNA ligase [Ferroacidibacillus organovorans]|uniref:Methionine--tRNA ligase n=1 Tax=Ferroacidibacillus organovorans TaxID=1765683 RepID=A0A117SY93_9BACL|nr:methionine--tRNA ligase [Ferroacidibacillus organovorans]KUO96591.1 methionine--tRNA ligase [Ferroacidibacillus organovorans]